jgi:hypothetical protein
VVRLGHMLWALMKKREKKEKEKKNIEFCII